MAQLRAEPQAARAEQRTALLCSEFSASGGGAYSVHAMPSFAQAELALQGCGFSEYHTPSLKSKNPLRPRWGVAHYCQVCSLRSKISCSQGLVTPSCGHGSMLLRCRTPHALRAGVLRRDLAHVCTRRCNHHTFVSDASTSILRNMLQAFSLSLNREFSLAVLLFFRRRPSY